jgi:hypothetical protein
MPSESTWGVCSTCGHSYSGTHTCEPAASFTTSGTLPARCARCGAWHTGECSSVSAGVVWSGSVVGDSAALARIAAALERIAAVMEREGERREPLVLPYPEPGAPMGAPLDVFARPADGTCATCAGYGWAIPVDAGPPGANFIGVPCPDCNGTGRKGGGDGD